MLRSYHKDIRSDDKERDDISVLKNSIYNVQRLYTLCYVYLLVTILIETYIISTIITNLSYMSSCNSICMWRAMLGL